METTPGLAHPQDGKTASTMVGPDPSSVAAPTSERRSARALLITFGPVLNPQGGLGVRARSVLEALSDLGLRTSVISHYEDSLDGLPADVGTFYVLRRRLRLGWSWELARVARDLANEADVVIVESALLLPALRVGRPTTPIVWDTNECETLHYSRLKWTLSNRLRLFVWREIERWAVRWTHVIVAVSETEATWWARLFPQSNDKLVVVRHRTLAEPVDASEARKTLQQLCRRELDGPVLLFVGTLAAKHNAAAANWLVDELAPSLPPTCILVLAGPGTERVRIRRPTKAQVIRLGPVPKIDAVIAGADACLAPLEAGAGVKTKVLHYLAHGKLVLATPVATEGLEGAPGVRVAQLEDFTAQVSDFLNRPEDVDAARRRAQRQRDWIEREFGAERVHDQLREALRRVGVAT
jgi:Glycosyl transferases group 1/Glycosyltransferase Family 4